MTVTGISIGALEDRDRASWEALYRAYAEYYGQPMPAATLDTVWRWLTAADGPLKGLVARDAHGDAVALLHYRAMPSPLRGATVGFVDDLFVSPPQRGRGVAEALFAAVRAEAERANWPFVRWITRAHNQRARAVYRRIASETDWVTCQMDVD